MRLNLRNYDLCGVYAENGFFFSATHSMSKRVSFASVGLLSQLRWIS